MAIPIITIIGKSGAGKTTLIEKLVVELKHRNYRVATIKHHSHPGFDIDVPGKDSWRFAQAGSDHVIIASPDKIASYRLLDGELSLDEIAAGVSGVDIILVEGYRQSGKRTLEIARGANSKELIGIRDQWIALVSDFPIDADIPHYDLNDIVGITNLIEKEFLVSSFGK
jgi:molybdopterin-guanine dinucleotide biosynthesis protein B